MNGKDFWQWKQPKSKRPSPMLGTESVERSEDIAEAVESWFLPSAAPLVSLAVIAASDAEEGAAASSPLSPPPLDPAGGDSSANSYRAIARFAGRAVPTAVLAASTVPAGRR